MLWAAAVGGEAMRAREPEGVEVPCTACGARDFEVTRPGWARGLVDWLRFGGRWRPRRRVCRRCGDASDPRSARDLPVGSVELVHVFDLEPYFQGQRQLQEAWILHQDQDH